MASPLTISADRRGGVTVLIATGEIDLSNIDAFEAALSNACETARRENETLTVDLSGVEYLDSGGINVLFANADRIHVIANPILMSVMKISGLTDVVSVESAGD